jgi:hypothetical protein
MEQLREVHKDLRQVHKWLDRLEELATPDAKSPDQPDRPTLKGAKLTPADGTPRGLTWQSSRL